MKEPFTDFIPTVQEAVDSIAEAINLIVSQQVELEIA